MMLLCPMRLSPLQHPMWLCLILLWLSNDIIEEVLHADVDELVDLLATKCSLVEGCSSDIVPTDEGCSCPTVPAMLDVDELAEHLASNCSIEGGSLRPTTEFKAIHHPHFPSLRRKRLQGWSPPLWRKGQSPPLRRKGLQGQSPPRVVVVRF